MERLVSVFIFIILIFIVEEVKPIFRVEKFKISHCHESGTLETPSGPLSTAALKFKSELESSTLNHLPQPRLGTLSFSYTPIADRYLKLIEKAVLGILFSDQAGSCNGGRGGCSLCQLNPYDPDLRQGGNDWPPIGHTMVGVIRLKNVKDAIEYVTRMGIPGDFVELGVWRGGVCIYAKALFDVLCQSDRDVLIFDAFEKLPGYGENDNFLSVSEDRVRNAFQLYGISTNGVEFLKGLFKDTLPAFRKERISSGSKPISILRLDGNFYDSYQDCLYNLYDFVPVGGVIIFDDFNHDAPNQAWKDFQTDQGFQERVTQMDQPDHHGGWMIKTVNVKVDFSKKRPPKDVNL